MSIEQIEYRSIIFVGICTQKRQTQWWLKHTKQDISLFFLCQIFVRVGFHWNKISNTKILHALKRPKKTHPQLFWLLLSFLVYSHTWAVKQQVVHLFTYLQTFFFHSILKCFKTKNKNNLTTIPFALRHTERGSVIDVVLPIFCYCFWYFFGIYSGRN